MATKHGTLDIMVDLQTEHMELQSTLMTMFLWQDLVDC